MTSKGFFKYSNANRLKECVKTGIYSTEMVTKQQTKAREVIINDIPEHLALCTAELDNKRLVIEPLLVCISGRRASNVGILPRQTPFS